MAEFIKKAKRFLQMPAGIVIEGAVYAAMLILVMIFFTSNGQFIYEGF